ncbi:hypothetical protein DKX38_023187 [Salix brachista]|uniref:Uncharacterized protein n=1 Tax=Salix brachista TaxID=2182728 RepID=A0A5N5K1R2_9ROSI|nr:hypothetical protein DKX38_023187 [Salix brachista]
MITSSDFKFKVLPCESNVFDHILRQPKLTGRGKSLQTLGRNELFSATAIESHTVLGEDKSDFIGLKDHETASGLKRFQRRMTELVTTQNTADPYPISAGWDPRGLKRKCSACIGEIFAIWRESASRKEETTKSMIHQK